jgi:hypothetical protein
MRGDFSRWDLDDRANWTGVLHQQGRVLTDADWNAQVRLTDRWQVESARAAFGRRVAAVSAADEAGLRVERALLAGNGEVTVEVVAGQVWADGLLAHLRSSDPAGAGPERRVARPFGDPAADPGAAGTRDAVFLELWREELHGFQVPAQLIEPALGGVDTTERVWTGLSFGLLRMRPDEECEDLPDRLADDLAARGRLTVELAPAEIEDGPCPVVVGGGYTGFEHQLYRVEIAAVDAGGPTFKWSRFNGGLVGRGTFDAVTRKVTIRANRQPILRSGLQSFYLEAYEPLPARPAPPAAPDAEATAELAEAWRLVYGGRATLANDHELDLTEDLFGAIPGPADRRIFFRLWDDAVPVADFDAAAPLELRDGIRLRFQAGGDFRPGDYWTFPVRAGEVADDETLVDDRPPEGPLRVRVPLAVLRWDGGAELTRVAREIDDCRRVFPPLTDLPPGCCVPVHPGDDIPRLVRRIRRAGGGCLCLLPGEHRLREPLDLSGITDFRIEGRGLASRLVADARLGDAPLVDLTGAAGVSFESFAVLTAATGPVFRCAGTHDLSLDGLLVVSRASGGATSVVEIRDAGCHGWRLAGNVFLGPAGVTGLRLSRSSITGNRFAAPTHGIRLSDLLEVEIEDNRFLTLPDEAAPALDQVLGGGRIGVDALIAAVADFLARDARTLRTPAAALRALLERLELSARSEAASRYVAIQASGLFDVEVRDNLIVGRQGLLGELAEDVTVADNLILTTVTGASFALAHGLTVSANRIGEERPAGGDAVHLSPRVGLRLLSDAIDCRIVDNEFLDVRDAIVFESDASGDRDVLRSFEADLRAVGGSVTAARSTELLLAARNEVATRRSETRFAATTFIRYGRCERTLIQGNLVRADGVGLQWSGTHAIADFRVSRNAFVGCGSGAILIEPDDRVFYVALAEPVDTQVRLIDQNRFDVLGIAVRSTLGAVRVEKNDVRVRPAEVTFVSPAVFGTLLTDEVFTFNNFATAVTERDAGNFRLTAREAAFAVKSNPATINPVSFTTKATDTILGAHAIGRGDVLADDTHVFSHLVAAGDLPLVVTGATAVLTPFLSNLEGFVINLGGIQNEVVGNNVLSRNDRFDGGAVLQLASGTVTGNEIHVGRIALLVTSKAGQGRQTLRIEGNRLEVTGPARGGGQRSAAYSLAIPTLTPGNYAVLDNHLEGSVMVGAEPFASAGLVLQGALDFGNFAFTYHGLAFDDSSFFRAFSNAAKPAAGAIATNIDPAVLNAVVVGVFAAAAFDLDPHDERAVIQFSDNRVVRGYVALARSTGGAFWSAQDLQQQAAAAPVIEVTGNVLDYWAKVVGRDLILVGNHSQAAIQFRAGSRSQQAANIPEPVAF